MRNQLQEMKQDRDDIRNTLKEVLKITEFFPEQWEDMKQKTQRARRMEEMYDAARQGEDYPGVSYNCWNGIHGFDVDGDGKTMDLKQFLIEYKHECDKQDIAADSEIYEQAEQIEKQHKQQDYEWER